jgi:hypothetical protein
MLTVVVVPASAVIANLPEFDRPLGKENESTSQRALAVGEDAPARELGDLTLLPEDLARFYLGQGRYTEAEAIYRRALTIYEEAPELKRAPCCIKTANCCRPRGQDAGVACQQCLAMHRRAAGTDPAGFVKTLEGYATLLRKMGGAAEVGKLELHAKAIREKQGWQAHGPEH